jgi:hypothetical protein
MAINLRGVWKLHEVRCSGGGILKDRRTNLPSTTNERIYNYKIATKVSGAVNSYSPSAEGA